MKSIPLISSLACAGFLLVAAGASNATSVVRNYADATTNEGGTVTFDDEAGTDQLRISIDNTTAGNFSTLITGIVFDINLDINAFNSSWSFEDGDGNAISGWAINLNDSSQTTPGNTTVDLLFETTNGSTGGIYNTANIPANPDQNIDGGKKDVAVLILTITDPADWTLQAGGISSDILRMQRAGTDGEGSLKLDGGDPSDGDTSSTDGDTVPMPLPGTLLLLGVGLLGLGRSRRKARA